MMNLIRSEFFKLRTVRLNLVMLVFASSFVVVILAAVGVFTPSANLERGNGPTSGEIAEFVGIASVLAGLLVSVVSAISVASEFGHGTIRPTLVATPSRVKVFSAKAIVLMVVAAVIGIATTMTAYLVGFSLLSARGAKDLELFAADGTIPILVGMPVFFVILAMFGFGLGLLIRNSPAAVAVAILWPLIIENILGVPLAIAGVDNPSKYLPYQSMFVLSVADSSEFAHGRVAGALYMGVVVAVLVVGATFVNTRRDV